MELRTPLHLEPSDLKIGYRTPGLLTGSCFAEQIGRRMLERKMPVVLNPFGILFNPASIAGMLETLHAGDADFGSGLVQQEQRWCSLGHHGSFSAEEPEALERMIRSATQAGHAALEQAGYLIVTWGTAWVYEHKRSGRIVANCHKLPAGEFVRRRLTSEQIVQMWEKLLAGPLSGKRVIFTVSPIRHLRDGLAENQLSKATLIVAAHALRERFAGCDYFPAYEIMVDDLRDYRFYERDMIHPSELAADYIWEQFCQWTMAPEALALQGRIEALREALSHRPLHPESAAHRQFREQAYRRAAELADEYPALDFSRELEYFKPQS